MTLITPVILSGGSGTRLWPMSRPEMPKQFLALTGDQTMFQMTAQRVRDASRFAAPLVVANARHANLLAQQLAAIGMAAGSILLEPCARNTAPAIALAAIEAGDAVLLVMPSDHVIADGEAFLAAAAAALPLAQQGWLVTFGIAPDAPETGYGYIKVGEALSGGLHRVDSFIEKPQRAAAEAMLAAGGHAWNGGIFMFRADRYLDELAAHAPAMHGAVRAAMAGAARAGGLIHPDAARFAACPSDSIDYAVMEQADRVAVAPVSMGWSDVGSWDALHAIATTDAAGNTATGDALLVDTSNTLVRSDGIRISVAGVDDLIIIASGNDVMIIPRGDSQRVKALAEARAKDDAKG